MFRGYIEPGNQFDVADIVSGMVTSGDISPGAVVSGTVASGAVTGHAGGGFFVIASGTVATSDIGSGAIRSGHVASGQVGNFHVASGQVQGLAGAGVPNVASGSLNGFELGSGAIVSGRISSGQIGTGHLADGAVTSGDVASGQLGRFHFASGTVVDLIACEQAISGVIAVAWGSGGCFVVPAERRSGLRTPAIGVVAGNFASGDIVPVVRRGWVRTAASGAIASGQFGRHLYLGSGGLIVNQSGYMAGASSGTGPNPVLNTGEISGSLVQRVGVSISGGIDVNIGEVTSGLLSGQLGQW